MVVNFFDADGLTGEHRAEIDSFLAQTDAAATGDHAGLVVQRARPDIACRELRAVCRPQSGSPFIPAHLDLSFAGSQDPRERAELGRDRHGSTAPPAAGRAGDLC